MHISLHIRYAAAGRLVAKPDGRGYELQPISARSSAVGAGLLGFRMLGVGPWETGGIAEACS